MLGAKKKFVFPCLFLGDFFPSSLFWEEKLVVKVFWPFRTCTFDWYWILECQKRACVKEVHSVLLDLALKLCLSMPKDLPIQLNRHIRWFMEHINITFSTWVMPLNITARIPVVIHSTQVNPFFVTITNVFGDSWKMDINAYYSWEIHLLVSIVTEYITVM